MQRPLCFDPSHASGSPSPCSSSSPRSPPTLLRSPHERFPVRSTSQQAPDPHRSPRDRRRRHRRRFVLPGAALRIRAAADHRLAERRHAGRGTARDPGHRQGRRPEIRHGDAVAGRHRAQARRRAVRPAREREEDRGGPGEGARREGRTRGASRHRARCLAVALLQRQRGRAGEERHDRHHAAHAGTHRRRPLREFRWRRRDRLQGVGGHGDQRREDRRLLLPGLPRPGEGPSGPLPGPLRASVQRRAGGEAHAGRHRQGRQHARDAARLRAEERQVQEEHHRPVGQLPAEQDHAAARRRRPPGRARRRTSSSP